MDKEREIRFLYPPSIVAAFEIWGWLGDPQGWTSLEHILLWFQRFGGEMVGIILGLFIGGSSILILGFILGTISYASLRILFLVNDHGTHEMPVDKAARAEIWKATGLNRDASEWRDYLMATAWLDFSKNSEGVHEWSVRRWNAFNVSLNIAFGLALTLLLFLLIGCGRETSPYWCPIGLAGILIFGFNAHMAWHDCMHMFRFSAAKWSKESQLSSDKGRRKTPAESRLEATTDDSKN